MAIYSITKLNWVMKFLNMLIFLGALCSFHQVMAQELEIITEDNQKFVKYKVQPGETVFSIAQKYNVSQNELLRLNPSIENVLRAEEIIRIPYQGQDNNPKLRAPAEEASFQEIKHTVKKGEGLWSIARSYDTTVDDIKKWNDLKNEKIFFGQELIVGIATSKSKRRNSQDRSTVAGKQSSSPNKSGSKTVLKSSPEAEETDNPTIFEHEVQKGESLAILKRKYNVSMADIRKWNDLKSDKIYPKQKLKIHINPEDGNSLGTPEEENPNKPDKTLPEKPINSTFPSYDTLNQNQSGNNGTDLGTFVTGFGNQGGNRPVGGVNTPQYSTPITRVVRQGETIYSIQREYNVRKTEIRLWNNMPEGSNKIKAEDTLLIYVPKSVTHNVQAGETLESIANKYKVYPSQIKIWNKGILSDDDLRTQKNLKLYIPSGPLPPGAPGYQASNNFSQSQSLNQSPNLNNNNQNGLNNQSGNFQNNNLNRQNNQSGNFNNNWRGNNNNQNNNFNNNWRGNNNNQNPNNGNQNNFNNNPVRGANNDPYNQFNNSNDPYSQFNNNPSGNLNNGNQNNGNPNNFNNRQGNNNPPNNFNNRQGNYNNNGNQNSYGNNNNPNNPNNRQGNYNNNGNPNNFNNRQGNNNPPNNLNNRQGNYNNNQNQNQNNFNNRQGNNPTQNQRQPYTFDDSQAFDFSPPVSDDPFTNLQNSKKTPRVGSSNNNNRLGNQGNQNNFGNNNNRFGNQGNQNNFGNNNTGGNTFSNVGDYASPSTGSQAGIGNQPNNFSQNPPTSGKMVGDFFVEEGFANRALNSSSLRFNEALHASAKIGSNIVVVAQSGQNVVVRIVGRIPLNEHKAGVIILLSSTSFQRLGGTTNGSLKVKLQYKK